MSTGRSSRSAGNDARSDARERALHLLYEAHAKSESGSSVVESQILAVDDLVLEIVTGVDGVTAFADEIIAENAIGWTLARMPVIDLIVLRIATIKSRLLRDCCSNLFFSWFFFVILSHISSFQYSSIFINIPENPPTDMNIDEYWNQCYLI